METQNVNLRTCAECDEPLLGRSDQRYCTEMCRTAANNRIARERQQATPECISRIQKALMNNYQILKQLHKRGSQLCSKLYLHDLGFNFHYHTSIVEQNNTQLYYIFNQGYSLQNDQVILVVQSDIFD